GDGVVLSVRSTLNRAKHVSAPNFRFKLVPLLKHRGGATKLLDDRAFFQYLRFHQKHRSNTNIASEPKPLVLFRRIG
ncbi:MAG TPA: hypothetical protein DEP46_10410, partial [Blastocatellia bacterium]|nr:hypothetical protein [Blastocatellia bacterium]